MAHQYDNKVIEQVLEALIENGLDGMATAMEIIFNEAMKAERSEFLAAGPHERTPERRGYSNGFKPKGVKSRIGDLKLEIPQVRDLNNPQDSFYPKSLEKGLRSERVLKARLTGVFWNRCQFHLQQNAQSYVPKVAMRKEVGKAIKNIFNAPDRQEAERRLTSMVEKYRGKAPKLAEWAERNLPEGLTVFELPESHRIRLRTTNSLERLNEEIKRRTRVARLFPNEASLLRLVCAVVSEISDEWEAGKSYLNMESEWPAKRIYRKDVA